MRVLFPAAFSITRLTSTSMQMANGDCERFPGAVSATYIPIGIPFAITYFWRGKLLPQLIATYSYVVFCLVW